MMLIRFLRDFRSKHTGENFYEVGVQADLADEDAAALLAEGVVEKVPLKVRVGQAEPIDAPKVEAPPQAEPRPRGRPLGSGRGR